MGVPSLYRWLTQRYPEIRRRISRISHIPVDNLFLDFNAIIHPCCNKELDTMDETDKQLYQNITDYLEMVVERMRPRRLLYISIDGVAPRAKLNQQRSRRFVSARENAEAGASYFEDTCGDVPLCGSEQGDDVKKPCKRSLEHSKVPSSSETHPEAHGSEGQLPGISSVRQEAVCASENEKETDGQSLNSTDSDMVEEIVASAEEEAGELLRLVFDSNAITPGTEFMVRLDCFIRELISYKISTDPLWANLIVIFSGYRVPGEGEQKILDYIRKHAEGDATNVIYSPDADLIFLGLTLQSHRLFVMREEFQPGKSDSASRQVKAKSNSNETDRCSEGSNRPEAEQGKGARKGAVKKEGALKHVNPYLEKEIVLVDINRLRSLLLTQFRACIPFNFDPCRFIEDWVFMCVAVGNDFLPCIPCFEIRSNAIDKITGLMIEVFKSKKRFITKPGGEVDLEALADLFAACARKENEFLAEKRRNLFAARRRMNLPLREEEEFELETEKGKVRFYMEKMGVSTLSELEKACREYVRGMVWVYRYYFYTVPSWDWYYPYHFAPFMCDLACVDTKQDISFALGRPLRPMEQLLAVLPATSRGLLPECLHDFFDENSEFYPENFRIDSFQKCMDWQAVPILPFIDTRAITAGFSKRQTLLTSREADRNTVGYSLIFSRNGQVLRRTERLYNGERPYELLDVTAFRGRVFAVPTARRVNEEAEACGFKYTNKAVCLSFDQRKCSRQSTRHHHL